MGASYLYTENHSPCAAIIDSQSVENGTMVKEAVGFDSGKRVKGRKRHFLVDTLGERLNGCGYICL